MRLVHFVNLHTLGGVERSFASFLAHSARTGRHENVVVLGRGGLHPAIGDEVERHAAAVRHVKYRGPLKLPGWPPAARAWNARRLVEGSGAEAAVLWARLGDLDAVRAIRAAGLPCAYWERGMSWFHRPDARMAEFLGGIDLAICNSRASQCMLGERQRYRGPSEVCWNGVELGDAPSAPRCLPASRRPVRLGMAGRLLAFKGFALGLHALRRLLDDGRAVELRVAGSGADEDALRQLADRLRLGDSVRWLGALASMDAFYRDVDLWVHPAVREPFGLVVAEALVRGIPAVVSRIDGLPEVCRHGETGRCVPAEEPIESLVALGASVEGLPEVQYDPDRDCVRAPRVVDPSALAECIASLLDDPRAYEQASASAIERERTRLSFARHFAESSELLERLAGTPAASDAPCTSSTG